MIEENIEQWKRVIKKEKEENMLKMIKQDIELEKDDLEGWLFEYERLIDDCDKKLIKKRHKNETRKV